MNIVIYKQGPEGHDLGMIFESQEQMETWADENRDKTFRAFQAQEFTVNKKVTFDLKPVSRDRRV